MQDASDLLILIRILRGDTTRQDLTTARDADRLIRLAEIHKVVYQLLLFAQQHPEIFTQEQIVLLKTTAGRRRCVRSRSCMSSKGLPRRCMKQDSFCRDQGSQLSRMLYGREALKESVDLDIMLVNPGDFERTHDVIGGLGYTWSNLNGFTSRITQRLFIHAKREVAYSSPATHNNIDLHVKPGSNTYLTARLFTNFFTGLESFDLEGVAMPVLPPEKYLAYLCYHGSLHQFSRLAWLLDIRAFLRLEQDALDYVKLIDIARSWRAERGLFTALRLLRVYFGDEIPEKLKDYPLFTPRINHLVKMCQRITSADESYSLSLKGRTGRFFYMMMLIRGLAGRWILFMGFL